MRTSENKVNYILKVYSIRKIKEMKHTDNATKLLGKIGRGLRNVFAPPHKLYTVGNFSSAKANAFSINFPTVYSLWGGRGGTYFRFRKIWGRHWAFLSPKPKFFQAIVYSRVGRK